MRVGVSLRSSYGTEPRTGARWMIERAAAADRAGLDSLFVGDHHSTGPGAYYQNVPVLGRLLAEWGDRTAGALFLLPLWHPVLVAEQIGTLAALAPGRFVMQTAIGGGAPQFGAMGVAAEGAHRAVRGRARRGAAPPRRRGGLGRRRRLRVPLRPCARRAGHPRTARGVDRRHRARGHRPRRPPRGRVDGAAGGAGVGGPGARRATTWSGAPTTAARHARSWCGVRCTWAPRRTTPAPSRSR